MTLSAEIRLQRGSLALDVSFEVPAGETVALLGPNGAGKTTCLHTLAGTLGIDEGRITLGDRLLDDGHHASFVPPHERHVGIVFQDGLLFPHLTLRENVAYGLRSRGVEKQTATARALAYLDRVGLLPQQNEHPAHLSGGQRQRAALARALASEPQLLLLDEPLAAVDATGALLLRQTLRTHLAAFAGPRILVTHDLRDALSLADRLMILESGRVVQSGTIEEIVARPRSRYIADLIGINCFQGHCRNGSVQVGTAQLTVSSPLQGAVIITIHPRAVALFSEHPQGSPRNVWRAPILALESQLERIRVQLGGPLPIVAELTPAAVSDLKLDPGREMWVSIKATELVVTEA